MGLGSWFKEKLSGGGGSFSDTPSSSGGLSSAPSEGYQYEMDLGKGFEKPLNAPSPVVPPDSKSEKELYDKIRREEDAARHKAGEKTKEERKKEKEAERLRAETQSASEKHAAKLAEEERQREKTRQEKELAESQQKTKEEKAKLAEEKRKIPGEDIETTRLKAFESEYIRAHRAIKRGGVSEADKYELTALWYKKEREAERGGVTEGTVNEMTNLRKRIEGKTFGSFMEHRLEDTRAFAKEAPAVGAKVLTAAAASGKRTSDTEKIQNLFGGVRDKGETGKGQTEYTKTIGPSRVLSPMYAKGMFVTPKIGIPEQAKRATYMPGYGQSMQTVQTPEEASMGLVATKPDPRDVTLGIFGYSPAAAAARRTSTFKQQLAGIDPLHQLFGQRRPAIVPTAVVQQAQPLTDEQIGAGVIPAQPGPQEAALSIYGKTGGVQQTTLKEHFTSTNSLKHLFGVR